MSQAIIRSMKVREGWLEKRQLRLPLYQKRYFVLTREHFMYEGKTSQQEDSISNDTGGKIVLPLNSLQDARAVDCSNFMLDFLSRQFILRTLEGNASSWVADIRNTARECGGLTKYSCYTKSPASILWLVRFARQEDSGVVSISSRNIRSLRRCVPNDLLYSEYDISRLMRILAPERLNALVNFTLDALERWPKEKMNASAKMVLCRLS